MNNLKLTVQLRITIFLKKRKAKAFLSVWAQGLCPNIAGCVTIAVWELKEAYIYIYIYIEL